MVKVFGWYYGKVNGFQTVEEGTIFHKSRKGNEETFLVGHPKDKQLKEKYENDKNILMKVYNKKKCSHNYKKNYGDSKNGGVYCSICGEIYDWDYRTEEDMEKLWIRANHFYNLEELEELREELEEVVYNIEKKKKEILSQEEKMDAWGIKY